MSNIKKFAYHGMHSLIDPFLFNACKKIVQREYEITNAKAIKVEDIVQLVASDGAVSLCNEVPYNEMTLDILLPYIQIVLNEFGTIENAKDLVQYAWEEAFKSGIYQNLPSIIKNSIIDDLQNDPLIQNWQEQGCPINKTNARQWVDENINHQIIEDMIDNESFESIVMRLEKNMFEEISGRPTIHHEPPKDTPTSPSPVYPN